MKTLPIFCLTLLCALPGMLNSQPPRPVSTAAALRAAKAGHAELLKRQAATLERLEKLQREAEQVRILSRRG